MPPTIFFTQRHRAVDFSPPLHSAILSHVPSVHVSPSEQVFETSPLVQEQLAVALPDEGQAGHSHPVSLHVWPAKQVEVLSKEPILYVHLQCAVTLPDEGQAARPHW